MIIYKSLQLYFGDKTDALFPTNIQDAKTKLHTLLQKLQLKSCKLQSCKLQNLVFLKQIHSDIVVNVDENFLQKHNKSFAVEGDALITNLKNVGIGVLTADCVPIILFDEVKHVLSVVHAGWKGTSLRIVQKTIQDIQNKYYSDVKNIFAFIGPSALSCCYEVSDDFKAHFNDFKYKDVIFEKRNNKVFCDVSLCNKLQLLEVGILEQNISRESNMCTMCTSSFFSHRRERDMAGRNATVTFLI